MRVRRQRRAELEAGEDRAVSRALDDAGVRGVYVVAALLAGTALSFCAVGAVSSATSEARYSAVPYAGLYLYDAASGMLVPAKSVPWGEGAAYVERTDVDPRYFPSVALDALESQTDVVQVVDTGAGDESPAREVAVRDISSYDVRQNALRGDAAQISAALPARADGSSVRASFVGYYVMPTTPWPLVAMQTALLAVVPLLYAGCLAFAAHRFRRRHLQEPLAVLDESAARIAAGDLDFRVDARADGNELDRLCASFEVMRAQLDANNKEMWRAAERHRRASAAFAHDLRTPLTVIAGRAELLLAQADASAADARQVREAAEAIERQAARLGRAAASLRDLDEAAAGSIAARSVEVEIWFAQCVDDCLLRCGRADVSLETTCDVAGSALFDEALAARVVDDLVANAFRFAQAHVAAACSLADGFLAIEVRDDGPGFSDEALDHACEPRWRDAAGECGDFHAGLGLFVCAALTARHGGGLSLSNGRDGGAAVRATFALSSPNETPSFE